MDFEKIIARAKAILLTPKTEWPVIAAEPATVPDLYKNYFAILAALPAIAGFISTSVIGFGILGVTIRVPIVTGIIGMVIGYVLGLAMLYVLSLIIDALAPTFGGEKNPVQALKAAGYSYTASWVAGIAMLVPSIGVLIALAGGLYGIYLLYLGLPATMKAPKEKAIGYTIVTIIAAIVLGAIVSAIVGRMMGTNDLIAAQNLGQQMLNR